MKLLRMHVLPEEDELANTPEISHKEEDMSTDIRPQWMKTLLQSVKSWLNLLPEVIKRFDFDFINCVI